MSNITTTVPAIFVGHGNPMNAIEVNQFTDGFRAIAETFPRPKAILSISAHWETRGVQLTADRAPRTIHDFYGFPQPLFDVVYPAAGMPELANDLQAKLAKDHLSLSSAWGIDHGVWSVLVHMFPKADIPVVEMSLNQNWTPREHYEFARQLRFLMDDGVLILGSGNVVHNLGLISWRNPEGGYDWAQEANEQIKKLFVDGDAGALADYPSLGAAVRRAVPTPEHFLPLLYILALKGADDEPVIFNDSLTLGSLSMTSFLVKP